MHEWPSAFAAADYNQNRDPEAKKYGMKRIWNNRSSARGWGKAAAVFTMAMVLAVGGLGAAMNLADLQGAVTVQPIVRQQSGTEPEQKTKLFGKKQTGSAASSEECAADSTEEPRTAEGPTAQAQPEAAEQPAAQTAESETTAEQGKEPAAAENPAEPAQDTAEEPDPLVPGRAEDAEPDTTESTETAETAQENSPVILQQETPELAAQDPQAPPEETDAAENDLSGRTPEGSMLLTDEQIRKALDEGALDEAEAQCIDLGDENGFFSWLWNWLFGKKDNQEEYTGWLTKNGKTYYYSASTHKPVTGIQSVDGKLYYFDADGVMQKNVNFGIDVSKYQSNIDWNKVKKAGVNFVIIRIGYRGYGASGTLVQDPMFEEHFTNARNAGLKVGVYFFTQAVTEDEAREEAQGCNWVLNGRKLDYPIYYDTEASTSPNGTGRADGLGKEDRTKCAIAFCEEVKSLGYKPGVYASTTWFRKRVDLDALRKYTIWNAHYGVSSSPIDCDMWQGTEKARIIGYSGELYAKISYMGSQENCNGPHSPDRIGHGRDPAGRAQSAAAGLSASCTGAGRTGYPVRGCQRAAAVQAGRDVCSGAGADPSGGRQRRRCALAWQRPVRLPHGAGGLAPADGLRGGKRGFLCGLRAGERLPAPL